MLQRTNVVATMAMSRVIPLLAAALLGGCAAPKFAAGSSADSVVQGMGAPSGEYRSPSGGRRLEYAGGAFGRRTVMFDFDTSDKLVGIEQALTEANFDAIRAGMSAEEVQSRIGRPSTIWRVGLRNQDIWSYRYESLFCQWFTVGMGPEGKVVDTGYGIDPQCKNDYAFRPVGAK